MKTMVNRQLGIGFAGFLIAVVVLILLLISGMKLIPAYIQNAAIKSAFDAIVHDPEMLNAKVSDIRVSFGKRAQVSDITVINAEDIEIGKDENGITLSASYSVKSPLAGNVSLLLEFNPSSSTK